MRADPTAELLWSRLSGRSQRLCMAVARTAADRGERAYLVGGSVRDLLLGEVEVDLDIVTEGDAVALGAALAAELGGRMQAPSAFLTACIELPDGGHVDLATARQETYPGPAKLPIVKPASIADDLGRRDFSVNAVALGLLPEGGVCLVDPCGGQQDIAVGIIRILHRHSFVDDPIRLIRAVRFEQRFGFAMEPATAKRFGEAVRGGELRRVTGTRVRDEIVKLLAEPGVCRALERLDKLGVLGQAVPGVLLDRSASRWIDRTPRGLSALRALHSGQQERMWPYVLGALCARGEWRRALEHLRLDRGAQSVVETMGRAAQRRLPDALVCRGRPSAGELDSVLGSRPAGELLVYWLRTAPIGKWRIEHAVARLGSIAADVTGHELIAQGVPSGPAIGAGLEAARAAKVNGDEDHRGQLEAALFAIRRWQRPERRRRRRPVPAGTEEVR